MILREEVILKSSFQSNCLLFLTSRATYEHTFFVHSVNIYNRLSVDIFLVIIYMCHSVVSSILARSSGILEFRYKSLAPLVNPLRDYEWPFNLLSAISGSNMVLA